MSAVLGVNGSLGEVDRKAQILDNTGGDQGGDISKLRYTHKCGSGRSTHLRLLTECSVMKIIDRDGDLAHQAVSEDL